MIKTINGSPLLNALKGLAAAFLTSLILLLILGKVLTESSDLEALTQLLPKAVQLISALLGGIIAGRFSKETAFISGILCGLIFASVVTLGSFAIGEFGFWYSVVSIIALTAISMLGSIIGSPKAKSESSRRKAMMKKLRR